MKIILVGGGSGGSVSPLLAVAKKVKQEYPQARLLFIGGRHGPEKTMAEAAGLKFVEISAGKLRRYFSWQNFIAPFLIARGFFQAREIIKDFKPDCILGAGSFLQVPVAWAGWLGHVPVVLHQQDFVPSLANRLCQPTAEVITVTFEKSLTDFKSGLGIFYKKIKDKVILTGNPFRSELSGFTREDGIKFFNLKKDFPVLLVLGGGTGAVFLNQVVVESLPELLKFVQVIHITGSGKKPDLPGSVENYQALEFTSHMGEAYAAADFVLCRAGISTLTELSNLKKPSIIVPMPKSHQELNGLLLDYMAAALVLPQSDINNKTLPYVVRKFLFKFDMQKGLGEQISKIMPKNSDQKIAKIVTELAGQHFNPR